MIYRPGDLGWEKGFPSTPPGRPLMTLSSHSLAVVLAWGMALSITDVGWSAVYRAITFDGLFHDWATVPVAAHDPEDHPGGIDLATVQIANDDDFLYLRFTFHHPTNPNALPPSTFITIDTDNSILTGFNVLGLDTVGADVGWQNDFPFEMGDDVFNTGGGLTNGAGSLAPFHPTLPEMLMTSQEIALPRFATFNATGQSIFPHDSITILIWTDETPESEHVGPISYTFARAVAPGDANGDGVLDAFDVAPFEQALADRTLYRAGFLDLDPDQWGDMDHSGALDAFDVAAFEAALAQMDPEGGFTTLPEPAAGLALIPLALLMRRRRAQ